MKHRVVRALGILLVGIGPVACGAQPPVGSATATPSPSASAAPVGSEPAAVGVLDVTDGGTPLAPGRYTRDGFRPHLTFEVGAGWEATQLGPGFFDVQRDVGSPHVIAVQFGTVDGVVDADGTVAPASAADAASLLADNSDVDVLETSESRIGGLAGSQATVENAGDAHAPVMAVPAGNLGIDPGRRLWIAFFDTDAGILAVMVGGSAERWEEALRAAEPVLESVTVAGEGAQPLRHPTRTAVPEQSPREHSSPMTHFGYALSGEEHRPADLVRTAAIAEDAGFSFTSLQRASRLDEHEPRNSDGRHDVA